MSKKKVVENEEQVSDRVAAFNTLKAKHPTIALPIEKVEPVKPEDCLPTPSLQINIATKDGGIRPGSIVEWYGPEGSLKTWIALEMCREAQNKWADKVVGYIDVEQRVDLYSAATTIGIAMEPFEDGVPRFDYYPKPHDDIPSLEEIVNRVYNMIQSGLYSLIVIDSIAAMMTTVEKTNEDITHVQVAGAPLALSKAFRKIGPACARTGTILWVTNQWRTSFTMVGGRSIAKKEPSGGLALRYAATHRFRCERMEKERESDTSALQILSEKIKYGPSMTVNEVPIVLGHGIDQEKDILMAAADAGVIEKTAQGRYFFEGAQFAHGENKAAQVLIDNPEMTRKIYTETLKCLTTPEPLS